MIELLVWLSGTVERFVWTLCLRNEALNKVLGCQPIFYHSTADSAVDRLDLTVTQKLLIASKFLTAKCRQV